MITVAGFNTSLDKHIEVDRIRVGEVVRVRHVEATPGGKGVHVANACAILGELVRLVGVIDRPHAELFRGFLARQGVRFEGVEVAGEIRTCMAIQDADGQMTELLEAGPEIDQPTVAELVTRVKSACGSDDVVAFAGSLPPGFSDEMYRTMVAGLTDAGARTLVDASGSLLQDLLPAHPFLVKLNRQEAAECTGFAIESTEGAMRAVRWLAAHGASRVVVSLGEDGIVAAWDDRVCEVTAPAQLVLNAVGAGDCLLAGIAVGLARDLPAEDTLRLGVACGAAKTRRREIGMLAEEDVEQVRSHVRLEWIG